MAKLVEINFILVQPGMWTEAELRTALQEILNIWAITVDGKLESLVITVLQPGAIPYPPSRKRQEKPR